MTKIRDMTISAIDLFNLLKTIIGEHEAKSLVEFIEMKIERKFDEQINQIATKKDLLRSRAGLELKIEKVTANMIKWMFIFCLSQIAVNLAFILIIL